MPGLEDALRRDLQMGVMEAVDLAFSTAMPVPTAPTRIFPGCRPWRASRKPSRKRTKSKGRKP